MKYMMIVCCDRERLENAVAEEDAARSAGDHSAQDDGSFPWLDDVIARGIRHDGDRLRPPNEATTVRVRGGETLLGDGPFAEAKEVIAGYDVIECANLDEAIEVAAGHPVAATGCIEVRPFWS